MNNSDLDEPIPIPVPVIIDQERFLRVGVRRAERSPRKTPPLHVTPRTLLTGLCRCGYCGSPMHITTGKGGRYRYLKCNRRNTVSNAGCASPNVPYEKFEKLTIQSVIENVLTDKRLEIIIDDCRNNIDMLSSTQGAERRQMQQLKSSIEKKLNNLYKLLEDEKVKKDAVLAARIQGWQDELLGVTSKLHSLKVPVHLPDNLLAKVDLPGFRAAVVAILSEPDSLAAKTFMHLAVEEIKIYADETTVSGSNLGMLSAMIEQTRDTVPSVPSFMRNWRRGRDSNPRYGVTVRLISSQVHSTTLPPLRDAFRMRV